MNYVIGTGPSGIAAAFALAKRDLPVCIVDSAVSLESRNEALKARLAAGDPASWSAEDLDMLKAGTVPTDTGVKRKLLFGSDFAYRDVPGAPPISVHNARVTRSFARGGLSNVWGACTLPYPEAETADWPVEADVMRTHYREVMEILPQSGADDGLATLFPSLDETPQTLPSSRQTECLLEDLKRSEDYFKRRGIRFGKARLAVDAEGEQHHSSCQRCALCLYGCPFDVIYSSSQTLARLLEYPNVSYLPGLWVRRLETRNGSVRVIAERIQTRETELLDASKVFVGAGVIETARIILDSLELYDTPITLRHSDRFVLPLVRLRGTRGISEERLHTSCDIFLEVLDPELCDYMIHMQVYGYNDLYSRALSNSLARFSGFGGRTIARVLVERLFVMFGYLHSDVSSEIEIKLGRGRNGTLHVSGKPNPIARRIAAKLARKLRFDAWRLRGVVGSASLDPPGGGNHSGGTFPMKRRPAGLETDPLGVPAGLQNVHIVDASILPSLSATTIALPVMANAHRIATLSE